jgi:hypothetical protein
LSNGFAKPARPVKSRIAAQAPPEIDLSFQIKDIENHAVRDNTKKCRSDAAFTVCQ